MNSHLPLQDFFRNPESGVYAISPNGKNIAFLAPFEQRMNIHLRSVANGDVKRLTEDRDRNISGLAFANDNTIVYLKDVGGDENFQLFAVDIDGGGVRGLTPFPGVVTMLFDMLKHRDAEILVNMNRRDPTCFDVVRVNVNTGELTTVAENPGNVTSWRTDHDGIVRVATTTDGVNHSLLYRDANETEFRTLLTTNFRESVHPLMFDFNNEKLYVSSDRGRNTKAIFVFNPATAKEEELLFSNAEYDVNGLMISELRRCVTGASYYSWKVEHLITDESTAAIFKSISEKLPGMEIVLTDCSENEELYLVVASTARDAASYYLYDATTAALTKLGSARPWLDHSKLADVKPVTYTSRDGLTIHGYLTLPNGVEQKNLPVIMYPHGGPWVRDRWVFDASVQFLANRGYAVMQMNYRGSTGYGRSFWEASFKQWGRAMQNDISDAVAWLVSEGIADPHRVAIVGGSYGGYAVLAGLAFTPELYRCGIDIVGVSNLFTFRKTIPAYWKPLDDMSNEMIGDPVADEELLRSVSPIFHVDNIVAPLLVFQGAKDPRVNIDESDQIVNALRSRGVDVEYIVKDDEGHGFMNEENKLEMFEIIERFLATHL